MTTAMGTIEAKTTTPAERKAAVEQQIQEVQSARQRVDERIAELTAGCGKVQQRIDEMADSSVEPDEHALDELLREKSVLEGKLATFKKRRTLLEAEHAEHSAELVAVQRQLTLEAQRGVVGETREGSRQLIARFSELADCLKTGLAAHDRLVDDQNGLLNQLGMPRLRSLGERFPFEIAELGRLLSVLVDGVVADAANQQIDHGGRRVPLTADEKRAIDPTGR